MTFLRFILLTSVIIAIALGAPADESTAVAVAPAPAVDKPAVPATTATADKKEDSKGVVATHQGWETYLSGPTWQVLSGALGSVLLIGGFGLAYYYYYFHLQDVNYSGSSTGGTYAPVGTYYSNPAPGYAQQQYYSPMARALDTGNNWNWPQVLYMMSMAQETYEKFDFYNLDCQKKALCEISHKQNDFGETGRKLTNTFSLLDVVEGLPMPTIIQTFLNEYREAINQGKNSSKDCGTIYPKCNFSLKEVFVKYQKKAAAAAEKNQTN